MNIAYLIEAHCDIERLICLCDALVLSGDVFIHIDKKNRDHNFWNKLINYEFVNEKVTVLKNSDRIHVAWAGFSQVECFKKLLKVSLTSTKKYDRFFLLSGLDFPVWSPQKIKAFFEENKDKEYVCGYNISTCSYEYQLRKIKYYHFFRDIKLPHKSILRRSIIGGSMLLLKSLGIKRNPYLIHHGIKWDIFFGSCWISITRPCAEYINSELKKNYLNNYFKTVYAPDELCIPTIVMNSDFRKNAIEIKELTFQNVTPLHYLNYEECIWSYDENDYDKIIKSNKMFVRKVVSGKSEKLIEMIIDSWKNINIKK